MVTFGGIALIVEVTAAACLAIALGCFAKWRSAHWLVSSIIAAVVLVAAAVAIIEGTT